MCTPTEEDAFKSAGFYCKWAAVRVVAKQKRAFYGVGVFPRLNVNVRLKRDGW